MTHQDAVTVATLVRAWANLLRGEIEELDSTLPLERKIEESYRYTGKEVLGKLTKPRADHPELYEKQERLLPHAELNELRGIVEEMLLYAHNLTGVENEAGN